MEKDFEHTPMPPEDQETEIKKAVSALEEQRQAIKEELISTRIENIKKSLADSAIGFIPL
jgi:hypothetical protein